jgi:hypothetical protein
MNCEILRIRRIGRSLNILTILFSGRKFYVLSRPIKIDAQPKLCTVLQHSNFEIVI